MKRQVTRPGARARRAPLLGAHQSIAGGLHRALERAQSVGCEARQWVSRPLAEDDVRAFAAAREATGIGALPAHDSYLYNLAAPDETLRQRSVRELVAELETPKGPDLAEDRRNLGLLRSLL